MHTPLLAHHIWFRKLRFFVPFFSDPLIFARLVVTQIWGHRAGSSPPSPHYGSCLSFYHEKTCVLSSIVDSRRTAPSHANRRSQHLIVFVLFGQTNSKSPYHTVGFELQNQRY